MEVDVLEVVEAFGGQVDAENFAENFVLKPLAVIFDSFLLERFGDPELEGELVAIELEPASEVLDFVVLAEE